MRLAMPVTTAGLIYDNTRSSRASARSIHDARRVRPPAPRVPVRPRPGGLGGLREALLRSVPAPPRSVSAPPRSVPAPVSAPPRSVPAVRPSAPAIRPRAPSQRPRDPSQRPRDLSQRPRDPPSTSAPPPRSATPSYSPPPDVGATPVVDVRAAPRPQCPRQADLRHVYQRKRVAGRGVVRSRREHPRVFAVAGLAEERRRHARPGFKRGVVDDEVHGAEVAAPRGRLEAERGRDFRRPALDAGA